MGLPVRALRNAIWAAMTLPNPRSSRNHRRTVVGRRNDARTSPVEDSQASGRAAVASPQAIPALRERFGSSQMPRSDRLTPIGSSIPDASLKTLVGARAAKVVAATATERFQYRWQRWKISTTLSDPKARLWILASTMSVDPVIKKRMTSTIGCRLPQKYSTPL